MPKPKPKPRVVYLIENKEHPEKLLYSVVCVTRKNAEAVAETFSLAGRVVKFVEVCDE